MRTVNVRIESRTIDCARKGGDDVEGMSYAGRSMSELFVEEA